MNRIEQLSEFLKESPQDPFLHYAITMEYLKLGDDDKTRKCFEQLVLDFPDYVGTYYHFGKFLEKIEEKDLAITIYNRGIEAARNARNMHALGELQGALNLLTGLEDDDNDEY